MSAVITQPPVQAAAPAASAEQGAPLVTTPAIQAQRLQAESTVAPPQPDFTWGGYFQAIGILLLLLLALWFCLRLVRRFGKGGFAAVSTLPRHALRLEAQLPLGGQKGIAVVRFLNKRLLLGVTDQHITLLTEMDADETPEPPFHQALDESLALPDVAPAVPHDGAVDASSDAPTDGAPDDRSLAWPGAGS